MSSLRVRAKNKLLTTIGTTKPSKNVQFDFAYSGYEKTQAGVVELETALRSYIICLKSYHLSAQALMRVIDNVGGSAENTAETKQFATEIKGAFVQLDGHLLNDSVKRFEQRVLNPTVGWLTRGHALKQQVATFHEEKLLYDHYTRKVMALRDARDKRAGSSKPEKPKDVEKLIRNEQKYAAITNSYSKLSDQTIARLREFVNSREDTLTPILHRMLEFRVKYASQVFDESQKLKPLIKSDSKYDVIMGQLEAFVGRLVGSQAAGATAAASVTVEQVKAAPAEPDVPVQSFSFESFVGEAPPAVPSESSSRASSFAIGKGSVHHQQQHQVPPPPPPLSSPSSPDAFFFDNVAHSATISPMATAPMAFDFQPPPPPPPPSAPESSGSAGAWDSFPAKPSAPPMAAANFATMPATGSSSSLVPSSVTLATTWGAFDDLTPPPQMVVSANPFQFQADFAALHQQALGSGDANRGVSGSVSF